jgi:hypothetical protein
VVNGKYRFVKRLTEAFTGRSNSKRIKGFRSLRKAEAYTKELGGLPEGWMLAPDARHGGIPEGWTVKPSHACLKSAGV